MAQTGRVIRDGEVYLGSYHYKLAEKTGVQQRVISAFPPKQITGEYDYANQEILSSWVIKDQRLGIGIEEMDESRDAKRCWFSTLQLGYRGHLPLPKLATSATIPTPTYDGTPVFANFNGELYMGKGSTLSKLNAGRTAFTAVKTDFAAKIVDLIVGPNNMLYIYLQDIGTGASDVLLQSSDAEVSTTSASYEKVKELTAAHSGTFRIKFDLSANAYDNTAYGRVYRNGVAVGTEQSSTVVTYVTKSEDISGWSVGDFIQLYIRRVGTYIYAKNFRVYGTGAHLYWYMNTAEVFTQTDVGDAALGVFWDSKLFKLDLDGNFWYTATPNSATPTWTSTGGITNIKSGDIKRLFIGPDAAGADIIYASTTSVLKAFSFTDGIWTDTYVKLPDHPTGGMGALTFRQGIYLSYGLDTLLYVPIQATVDAVGLSRDDGIPVEYNGEVVFFADGDAYLIALVDASKTSGNSKSGVFAWDGQGWQCLWTAATNNGAMNSAIVSSASSGYALYFDHASTVYYIDLQRGIRNINKLPAVATYASSGLHISPWFDAGSAIDSKTAKRLVLYCRGMSATETIIVKYRINHTYTDLDTGWTTLGTITSNGQTTYSLGSGAGIAFDDIQFRFDLARGSTTTNTPDFTAVLEYLKRKTLWAWSFVIDASGDYDHQTPRQQETSLNTLVEAALLQEFTFRGETDESESHWCFVQPFSYDTQTGEQHHSQYKVTCIEP